MPKGLRNVQLIKVGTWSGSKGPTPFNEGDLEDIVRSFGALGGKLGFRPHLKLGHTEAQKFFGQRAGFPSLGEVSNVWRDGSTVYANIDNIPEALLDLIEKRRYTQLSIELIPTYKHDGVEYRNVLVGVALLGAELPAVKGLADLAQALYKEDPTVFKDAGETQEFTEMPAPNEPKALTQADLDKAVADAAAAATGKLTTDLKAATDANALLLTRIDNTEKTNRTAKIAGIVDDGIKAGKIAPKSRDAYIAMGEAQAVSDVKVSFGEGDKKVEKAGVDAFSAFVDGLAKIVDLSESGNSNPTDTRQSGVTAQEQIDAKAHALVKEGNAKDYPTAFAMVVADPANEALKQAYAFGGTVAAA